MPFKIYKRTLDSYSRCSFFLRNTFTVTPIIFPGATNIRDKRTRQTYAPTRPPTHIYIYILYSCAVPSTLNSIKTLKLNFLPGLSKFRDIDHHSKATTSCYQVNMTTNKPPKHPKKDSKSTKRYKHNTYIPSSL